MDDGNDKNKKLILIWKWEVERICNKLFRASRRERRFSKTPSKSFANRPKKSFVSNPISSKYHHLLPYAGTFTANSTTYSNCLRSEVFLLTQTTFSWAITLIEEKTVLRLSCYCWLSRSGTKTEWLCWEETMSPESLPKCMDFTTNVSESMVAWMCGEVVHKCSIAWL